jgi:hypothetical protein
MPKFLVVHTPFPTPMSVEEAIPLLKRATSSMTAEAYWISSYCQANDEGKAVRVYCRWDGTSLEAVQNAVGKLMPEMPVEGVYPLMTLDSGDFR